MVSFKDYLRNVDDGKSKHLLETVWKKSIFHLNRSDFSSCFDCYTFLLENCPQIGSFIERDLKIFLGRWIDYVVSHKREDQLQAVIAAHAVAVRHCQDAGLFFNSCGKLFFRLQKLLDAKVYFEEARKLSPKNMEVLENVDNLNSLLLDRWHFPMLNDAVRNSSYKRAIEGAFSRISSVSREPFVCLDIGAGTGLLSMYMARAADDTLPGKVKVVSCEMDECMFRTAEEVLLANRMSEKIELVHSSSNSLLSLPGCHDDMKLKLVITETFDAGLLGEGVLESLDHVHRVLGKSGTDLQVIPRAATVYVCLLESEDIRNYSRYLGANDWLTSDEARIFCNVGGKADDAVDGFPWQPYTCERISSLGRSFALLSEPVALETINFESHDCVSSCLAGITRHLSVRVNRSGSLDAIALWFNLHLDSETDLSTSPLTLEGQKSCWQQAVYPVFNINGHRDVLVKEGDLALIECEIKDLIRLRCSGIHGPSNSDNETLDSNSPVPSFYLPPSSNALLNDSVYHRKCCEALEKIFPAGGRNDLGLVVASRPDSLSGLAVALWSLRRGVRVKFLFLGDEKQNRDFDDGISGVANVSKMLVEIADRKGLDSNLVSFGRFPCESAGERIGDEESSDDDDDDDDDEEEDEDEEDDEVNWAVGFVDPIESSGSLASNSVKHLFRLRNHLSMEHKILPSKIHCMGVLVDSQSLASDSAVLSGESTSPFQVADAINKFKTSYHVNFHLSTLPHTRLTDPIHLFTFDTNTSPTATRRSFSDKSCTLTINPVAGGRLTSLVYWFRLELMEGLVVDTLEGHWKQAAVHLDSLKVDIGDILKLEVQCRSGYFRAQVEKV